METEHANQESATVNQPLERLLDLALGGDESGSEAQALRLAPNEMATERLTLARALEVWQREQERRFNRAWRRPGGLARPAGL